VDSSPPPCGTIVITYKALSTSNYQPANEFVDCAGGYFLADGTLIAASLSDLFYGPILNSINRTETGNINSNNGQVWTGTQTMHLTMA
jgi:hypothetical protein